MDESGTPHNRRSQRSNLLMTAMLEVAGKTVTVKLRNLSSEGARVEGDQLPVEGTELVFRKGDLSTAARVVWIKGRQAGIGFEQKLDPVDVLNHVTVPRPRVQPDFRRPGLGSRELTPSERAMAARWIVIPPTVIE
jgi:hypothetical protein